MLLTDVLASSPWNAGVVLVPCWLRAAGAAGAASASAATGAVRSSLQNSSDLTPFRILQARQVCLRSLNVSAREGTLLN